MRNNVIRLVLLFFLIVTGVFAFQYRASISVEVLQGWIDSAGFLAPLMFMLIYALGTVLFLPGSILTIAGGVLFGPVLGTFLNLTGATLGATLAFLISRYLASEWVERRSAGKVKLLKNGVEKEGWRFVAFVRLVPLFPFNLINYALGLTSLRLSHFVIASYLAMLPGAFAYTYLGYASRQAVSGDTAIIEKALLALALLALVAFIPRLIQRIRTGRMVSIQEVRQQLDDGVKILLLDVRKNDEFSGEQCHVRQATNIELEGLDKALDQLEPFKDKPVYTICRTDRRSSSAAVLLEKAGFTNVHIVEGGMVAWRKAGYPVICK